VVCFKDVAALNGGAAEASGWQYLYNLVDDNASVPGTSPAKRGEAADESQPTDPSGRPGDAAAVEGRLQPAGCRWCAGGHRPDDDVIGIGRRLAVVNAKFDTGIHPPPTSTR
jgi:hypothetical protein